MIAMKERNLSESEICLLESAGNTAECWENVLVQDPFIPARVKNNSFYGHVRIGAMEDGWLEDGKTRLPLGISGSMLMDCEIGPSCAIHNVRMLRGYSIGGRCLLFNIDELSADDPSRLDPQYLEVMNENGGRRILVFPGMTVGAAYLWARFRGRSAVVEKLDDMARAQLRRLGLGTIGDCAVAKNCKEISNVTVLSSADAPSKIYDCVALTDGVVGYGCHLEFGIIAQRFLLGEHVTLEYGLRLNDTVVGDNSTVARCEVGNSIIFPAHEQHHNNSFLIAGLIQGQSNIAAGGTLGSNHNGRTADNELAAGRGFWPGLCASVKHSSRFASYTLIAKADYPSELDIRLPFALVNNNVAENTLEVMPAYWWMYNMYALNRNIKKFAKRDKRFYKEQHIEFDPFAPDTAEEMLEGRKMLESSSFGAERLPFEHGKRPVKILKAKEGFKAYGDMLLYYAMRVLTERFGKELPDNSLSGVRETRWVNLGGQLVAGDDMDRLLDDIEVGRLTSWDDLKDRLDQLWDQYPEQKLRHAYQIVCELNNVEALSEGMWQELLREFDRIEAYVEDQKVVTRKKDDENPYRNMTYWDEAERDAVLG